MIKHLPFMENATVLGKEFVADSLSMDVLMRTESGDMVGDR